MLSQGRLLQFAWGCLLTLSSSTAQAAKISERFSFGGYASTERFKDDSGGSDNNDFATISARSYLRVQDWGVGRWEFVGDLRDKNDFFDKLDAERLKLTNRNEFQIRQLSLRKPNPAGFWSPQVGRFAVPEAGAVFVDGAQVGTHWSRSLTSSIFGGLNPKQDANSYLEFNPKASVYGANLTFQDRAQGWNKNLYISHAIVQKGWEGHVDRQFLFHNMHFQWQRDSRLISLVYLDFVPRTYVQTASVILQQALVPTFGVEAEGLSIDAIEYSRRQGVLESLPSSPYRQGVLTLSYRPDNRGKVFVKGTSGKRTVDQKSKTEGALGWIRSGIFSAKWDANLLVGGRKNFTSTDQFGRAGLGYFSRTWETTLDFDYAIQKYETGRTLHPMIAEAAISHYHSRSVYWTLSAQRAADEDKTILSVFFKIGIQTGNQELAPIRDGAPPRGAL